MYESRTECRSCNSERLTPFLSLGELPLTAAFVSEAQLGQPEVRIPLTIAICEDCSLVQTLETVAPEVIFSRDYAYYSSYSDALLEHSREHALALIASRKLDESSLVVELASNDGYLLRNFVERGVGVLGIDPAEGPAKAAEASGVKTLHEFFGEELAGRLRDEGLTADVIIANNVLAHVPDLNGFVEGIRLLLKPCGVASIEAPYVRDLVEGSQFDTMYHEHQCYFSVTALKRLFERHELYINRVEHLPIHGGSLRIQVGLKNKPEKSVRNLLKEEAETGVAGSEYYEDFAERVRQARDSITDLLRELKSSGKSVAAYGAAAKGCVLLNYGRIGPDVIDFVADRNVHKQGMYMPGVSIPVRAPEDILVEMPDYLLLLAWNFGEEIMKQQDEYARRGGKFILPIPSPQVVSRSEEVRHVAAKSTPKLSIGLPIYNGEDYLRVTIDAILGQTFEDFELLISDNASTDATEEICREYAAMDSRIRYLRARTNRGASWNYKRVFDLTNGPYFRWATDDDLIAPRFLERCVEALDDHQDAVAAYTLARHIDSSGSVIEDGADSPLRHFEWPARPQDRFRQLMQTFQVDGGASAPMLMHGVIRREPLAQTHLMQAYFAADIVLLADLMLRGTFVEVPELLFDIRLHPGSSSWPETWTPESVQEFYDPRVKGKLNLSLSMRRHYLEYFGAVARSPLGPFDKAELLLYCTTPPLKKLGNKLGSYVTPQSRNGHRNGNSH